MFPHTHAHGTKRQNWKFGLLKTSVRVSVIKVNLTEYIKKITCPCTPSATKNAHAKNQAAIVQVVAEIWPGQKCYVLTY